MRETDGVVVLVPAAWIGKEFPLTRYIDIGPRLAIGHWIILLYHWDCATCRRAIPAYQKLSAQSAQKTNPPAFVAIPPYAPPGRDLLQGAADVAVGRLTDSREWIVATPVMIELLDGKVLKVAENEQALEPPTSPATTTPKAR
jgi:hypothetical protein